MDPNSPDAGGVRSRAAKRPFYGRERELAELRSGLAEALSHRGRFFLVAGDPGIGKTRLLTELATVSAELGAKAFWGRCWEAGGAPAYWPWIQVLRACLRSQDSAAVEARIGLGGSSIAELVPELGRKLPRRPGDGGDVDYEHARFYLFDAVTSFLKAIAAAQPLVIVLDDLHAADEASLLLLRFLAQEIQDSGVLLVAAYREGELRSRPRSAEVLRHLSRQASRIPLGGLSEAEIEKLLSERLDVAVSPTLAAEVHRATEGNPFFVDEIVRLLAAEGRLGDDRPVRIPESVHETIRRRFLRLSGDCREILAVASVVGRDFNIGVIAQVTGVPLDDVLERLGEAVESAAVVPVADVVGRYSFAHALVRETFYVELAVSRRRALHRKIGEALEAIHAGDLDPHLAVIAHHHFLAATSGSTESAIRYAILAGERAARLLAFEEAATQFRRALDVLALEARPGDSKHCEILLSLGDAQRRAGDLESARASCAQAAEIARAAGAKDAFAKAALCYGGGLGGMGYVDRADREHIALLEEAIDWLGAEDSVLRVQCLARLAAELYYTDFVERRRALSEQAVAMAARLGDVGAIMTALHSRHWSLWGPDSNPEEQRRASTELLRLAERLADKEMLFRGHQLRLSVELVLGEIATVDHEIESCAALAAELRQPVYLWQVAVFRGMRALLRGHLQEAERLLQEAAALGHRGYEATAQAVFGAQLANLYWMQGRLATIEPLVIANVEAYPFIPAWRAGLAFLYIELGRRAEARAQFEILARDDFVGIPRDGNWLDTIYILSLVCAYLKDSRHAVVLHQLLEPYADRNATVTANVVCLGPVALGIGALAVTLGRWDEAERMFVAARQRSQAMGAPPNVAFTLLHHAKLRLARREPGDVEQARTLVEQSLRQAEALHLAGIAEKGRELLASIGPERAGERPAFSEAAETAMDTGRHEAFRREGDFWTIVYESKSFRLRDAKGLRYIAELLQRPGDKFGVAELTAIGEGSPLPGAAPPVDPETLERMRKAVANSIRYAIARIDKECPALALHLTNSLRTGASCCYVPDRPRVWEF